MALTVQENYNDLIAEKELQPTISSELSGELIAYPDAIGQMRLLLAELNSKSKVAIWRLWCFVIAAKMTIQQRYFDQAKVEIQAIVDKGSTINNSWLVDVAYDFQYGDTLSSIVGIDGKKRLLYEVQDDSKKVVKAASISKTANGVSLLKVAAEAGGSLAVLPIDQLNALKEYIDILQPPGCNIIVSTADGDIMLMDAEIYYNPLMGTGAYFETAVSDAVKAAIKSLSFAGVLTRELVEDAIKSVSGVVYFDLKTLKARTSGGSYGSNISLKYYTVAGYVLPDSDPENFKVTAIAQIGA